MRLNNRGISIIELIISLILMSIVVFMMYNLVFKINDLHLNAGFAINNQSNRIEIIKTIENDWISNHLVDVEKNNNQFTFTFIDGKYSYLNLYSENESDYIEYIIPSEEKKKWLISGGKINYSKIDLCQSDNVLKLNIVINTNDELNNNTYNNTLDDISLTYVLERKLVHLNECSD